MNTARLIPSSLEESNLENTRAGSKAVEDYRRRRLSVFKQPAFRTICDRCRQPDFSCYCEHIRPVDPMIEFVILMHPIERRRRIATGRMAHLTLLHSQLRVGREFTNDPFVRDRVADPSYQCALLYPGRNSTNLTYLSEIERKSWREVDKKISIFVVDGTWGTANKMIRLSPNLRALPKICFTPASPSNFRIRKQPNVNCLSTIEAIHQTIEFLGESVGFATGARAHDVLLDVFDKMVSRQLDLAHSLAARVPGN